MPNKEIIVKRITSGKSKQLNDNIKRLMKDPKYQSKMEKATFDFVIDTENTDTENPDVGIFSEAEILMENLNAGIIKLGQIDLVSKCKLLYYLERYNKRVGRVLDIQTRIPLSSIRLQKPKTKFNLVSDYVFNVFNSFFESYEFQQALEKIVRHYWLFSFSSILIEDDFEFLKEMATDETGYKVKKLSEKEYERIKQIDIKYSKAPDTIPAKERLSVIEEVLGLDNKKYRGIKRITVLPVLTTLEREENLDLDYYKYPISFSSVFLQDMKNLVIENTILDENSEEKLDLETLLKDATSLGYSEAKVRLFLDTFYGEPETVQNDENSCFYVDTNPYTNGIGMYVAVLQRPGMSVKDNSLFNRIIMDCIDLSISSQRLRDKVNRGFKKDILVTVGELEDAAKIDELNNAITDSAQSDEGNIIITNMNANVQDLDLNVNSNLDLNEIIESANRNISEGVGIPESLITDSTEAYSNSFLKTLILENEMLSFRRTIKQFIEEKIFKPVAVKYGFIMEDEWGDNKVIYPEITFNRMSLARGSDDLELLRTMQSEGTMSLKVIFESLGLDYDETVQQILKEQTHITNPDIRSSISSAIGEQYSDSVAKSKRIKQELAENLEIPEKDLDGKSSEDDNYM